MPESGERARFSRSAFFRQSPRAVLPEKTRRRVCRCLAYGSTCSHHCPFSVPCSSRNQSQQEEEEYNVCIWKTRTHQAHRTLQCSRGRPEGIAIMPWHHSTYQSYPCRGEASSGFCRVGSWHALANRRGALLGATPCQPNITLHEEMDGSIDPGPSFFSSCKK